MDMSAVEPSPRERGRPSTTTLLGGRYSLTKRIAIGGMGQVWKAEDTVLGRDVAVKILRDDLVDSPVFLERFRAEARHTARLSHIGIASVFDYGEDRDGDHLTAYLVLELVEGRPLSTVMAEQGTLPVGLALSVLAQAAEALSAAHVMGVVHRDVKPGNLLLLDNGLVKVTDFGIARAANSLALTEVGQVIGTARYISPEQATGSEATPASDVYSLGVIGFEMLAGEPPFTADNAGALAMAHVHQSPPPLPDSVPEGVRAAIAAALSKDPADRPADAHEFASQLRRLQLDILPPPGTTLAAAPREHDPTDSIPATQLMGAATVSRTAIMPDGLVAARSPDLGLSEEAHASRRLRRRLGIAAVATVAVVAFLLLGRGGANPPVLDTPTTIPVAPTVAVPVTTIGVPATTSTVETVPVKDKGKGNGKGNGNGNGKP